MNTSTGFFRLLALLSLGPACNSAVGLDGVAFSGPDQEEVGGGEPDVGPDPVDAGQEDAPIEPQDVDPLDVDPGQGCLIAGQRFEAGQRSEDGCGACAPGFDPEDWTPVCNRQYFEEGFEDFGSGRFEGAHLHASARQGHLRLAPTLDLNVDGDLDLVFVGYANGAELIAPTFIYWGDRAGPVADRRTVLPGGGRNSACAADFDEDGLPDLFLVRHRDGDIFMTRSSLYLGSSQDEVFSIGRAVELETRGAGACSFADLNRDGWLDLVISSHYVPGPNHHLNSLIYWGSEGGFNAAPPTELPTIGAANNAIADLNSDGWLDVVFANHYDGESTAVPSILYWGSPGGFSTSSTRQLDALGANGVAAGDVNGDRHLDLIFTIPRDDTSVPPASVILLGGPDGPGDQGRLLLPTAGALEAALGDFDRDGFPDLAVAQRSDQEGLDLGLFTGVAGGFNVQRRQPSLPTLGANGVLTADFNDDGFVDIAVSNFNDRNQNEISSPIFWGGPLGFDAARRSDFPTVGAQTGLVPQHDAFEPPARFTSAPIDLGGPSLGGVLSWRGEVGPGGSVRLHLRSAPTLEALEAAPWLGPDGTSQSAYDVSSLAVSSAHDGHRFWQYRAELARQRLVTGPHIEQIGLTYGP